MITALARFVAALRSERQVVSPAEVIDASHALDLVGLTQRTAVKAALRATLAKDRRAAAVFDRLFDRFFTPPRLKSKGEGAGRIAATGQSPRPRPSDAEAKGPPRTKPKARAQPRKPSSPQPRAEPREPATIDVLVKRDGEKRDGRLRRVRLRPAAIDALDPAHRELAGRMTTEEERAIAREIPRMVQSLKLRLGRREAAARAGRPWLRRALRDNLRHGGVPFVIPHRAPKRKSTRVVLLCDVSFSVARASGLFLLMAAAFLDLGRRVRVLAFVDRPVDATPAVRRWVSGARSQALEQRVLRPRPRQRARPGDGILRRSISFAEVLDGLRELNLDAPSDYGTAFHALSRQRLRPRGRDTVLVILGDGRTNRFDPLPWALAEVAAGCKGVLWLVPEPRSRWGLADSALPAYAGSVDVLVEADDLAGLSRGLTELLRRL